MYCSIYILIHYKSGEARHGLIFCTAMLRSLPLAGVHLCLSPTLQHTSFVAGVCFHQVVTLKAVIKLLSFTPRIRSAILGWPIPFRVSRHHIPCRAGFGKGHAFLGSALCHKLLVTLFDCYLELVRVGDRNVAGTFYCDGQQIF